MPLFFIYMYIKKYKYMRVNTRTIALIVYESKGVFAFIYTPDIFFRHI